MGRKDKKRSRGYSDTSTSEDSGGHKKRTKKHKKDKKEKSRLKEAKKLLKESKGGHAAQGESWDELPRPSKDDKIETISEDSYFQKNAEFREWLKNKKGVLFGDLPTEEGRKLFASFVEAWNGGQLPTRLYTGDQPTAVTRTSHKWALKGPPVVGLKLGMEAALEERQEQLKKL